MQVILQKTVSNLGFVGDIVNVRDGYYRNYLSPRGLAALATKGSVAEIEHQKRVIEAKKIKEKSLAENLKQKIKGHVIELSHAAGDGDKLFGSITTQEIATALKEAGYEVDKKQITIEEAIKTIGEHEVSVKLHPEVSAVLKVLVVRKEAPAKGDHE